MEGGGAIVAEEHVLAAVRADIVAGVAVHVDGIRTHAAEDEVVAVADYDVIVAAGAGDGGLNGGQHAICVKGGLAVVADHYVPGRVRARVDVV